MCRVLTLCLFQMSRLWDKCFFHSESINITVWGASGKNVWNCVCTTRTVIRYLFFSHVAILIMPMFKYCMAMKWWSLRWINFCKSHTKGKKGFKKIKKKTKHYLQCRTDRLKLIFSLSSNCSFRFIFYVKNLTYLHCNFILRTTLKCSVFFW